MTPPIICRTAARALADFLRKGAVGWLCWVAACSPARAQEASAPPTVPARRLDDGSERAPQRDAEARRAKLSGEFKKRSAELVANAKSVAEVDAFLQDLRRAEGLSDDRSATGGKLPAEFDASACVNLMQSLGNLLDPSLTRGPSASAVVGQFMEGAMAAREFAPMSACGQRASKVFADFQKAADTARDALCAALVEGKPYREVDALGEGFVESTKRFSSVATTLVPDYPLQDCETTSKVFQDLAFAAQLINLRQWKELATTIAEARASIPQLPPGQALALDALLAKLERKIPDGPGGPSREFRDQLRAQLGAVKGPANLMAISTRLSIPEKSWPGSESSWIAPSLAKHLAALAAAWIQQDLNLLPVEKLLDGNLDDAGIAALRDRIGREIVSRRFDPPELHQAPFLDQPFEEVLGGFIDAVTAEGKWDQALRAIDIQNQLRNSRGVAPQNQRAAWLARRFLDGESFEAAGLWTEAASEYKSVLASEFDGAALKEAAERLKALAKEHPEAIKKTRARPKSDSPESRLP